jgi:anti-sigma factor (TIGR02949 family)
MGSGGDSPEMVTCQEALARLYDFLDGELDGVSHSQVETHFQKCARCYPHLAFEQNFREALHRAVEGQAAPPELRSRVLRLLDELPSDG